MNINQIEVKGITYQVEDTEARSGLAQAVVDIDTTKEELKDIAKGMQYTIVENTENLKIYFKEDMYSKNLIVHMVAYNKKENGSSYQNGETIYNLDKDYCPPITMRGNVNSDTLVSGNVIRYSVTVDINSNGEFKIYFNNPSVINIVNNVVGFNGDINIVWLK